MSCFEPFELRTVPETCAVTCFNLSTDHRVTHFVIEEGRQKTKVFGPSKFARNPDPFPQNIARREDPFLFSTTPFEGVVAEISPLGEIVNAQVGPNAVEDRRKKVERADLRLIEKKGEGELGCCVVRGRSSARVWCRPGNGSCGPM